MKRSHRNRGPLSVALLGLTLVMFGLPIRISAEAGDTLNAGDVLIGPCGVPGAMGAKGMNDDFTNRSINSGITMATKSGLTSEPGIVEFRNTIQNTGGGDDVFLITAPVVPSGFTLELSLDYGEHYIPFGASNQAVPVSIAFKASATVRVRVTAPAGLKFLTGFDTVIRATSTLTPSATNETIDRLYTSFVKLEESTRILNPDGTLQAKQGSVVEFLFSYSNVSTAAGVGSSILTAHNIVISENGNAAANNWAQKTEHLIGASDSAGGTIIGDRENSTSLTDIVTSLEPGQSGVFKFRRRIK
jgi:hypothetical protein